jgi:hypothetical protein
LPDERRADINLAGVEMVKRSHFEAVGFLRADHHAADRRHAKQTAVGLSTDEPGRRPAKAVIAAEVERLRWRIWNGKAKNARRSIDRIRKVMHLFKGERGHRTTDVPSRKL